MCVECVSVSSASELYHVWDQGEVVRLLTQGLSEVVTSIRHVLPGISSYTLSPPCYLVPPHPPSLHALPPHSLSFCGGASICHGACFVVSRGIALFFIGACLDLRRALVTP